MNMAPKRGWSSGGSSRLSSAAAAGPSARPISLVVSMDVPVTDLWRGPARLRGSCENLVPDVEEVEPLGRVLPHHALEHLDPCARGLRLAAARDAEGLGHLHRVAVARAKKAERRHHRHADGAGREKWPEREWRGLPEERNQHIAARAQRPVRLDGHHLAPPERGDQLQRYGRPGAGG